MSQITKTNTGGGGGGVTSVTGVGNIVASPTTGAVIVSSTGIQVIRGPSVDLEVTGATPIFTTTGAFIPTQIIYYGVNVTGVISLDAQFNIGWTAPNYDDLLIAVSSTVQTTGDFVDSELSAGSPLPAIPAATQLFINVTVGATTTGNDVQRIDLYGYYV